MLIVASESGAGQTNFVIFPIVRIRFDIMANA
jgi:hypothetical protein